MTQTVTIASTGNSSIIDLNPSAKETILQVTVSAGSSGTTYIQATLDDQDSATTTWGTLSSAINSSAADSGIGQTLAVLSPISGVRLLTQSSTTSGVVGTVTLKVLQTVTA